MVKENRTQKENRIKDNLVAVIGLIGISGPQSDREVELNNLIVKNTENVFKAFKRS